MGGYECLTLNPLSGVATDAFSWPTSQGISYAQMVASNVLQWTDSSAYQATSSLIDAYGCVTNAAILWPDGGAGVFICTTENATWHTVDAYRITYTNGATWHIVTQSAVSRDGTLGVVTNQPALTLQ